MQCKNDKTEENGCEIAGLDTAGNEKSEYENEDDDEPEAWIMGGAKDCPWSNAMMKIDSLLRCAICKDPYNACVSLPCQHKFCSSCIRRAFIQYSGKCPHCNAEADSNQITVARDVQDIVVAFNEVKKLLLPFSRKFKSLNEPKALVCQPVATGTMNNNVEPTEFENGQGGLSKTEPVGNCTGQNPEDDGEEDEEEDNDNRDDDSDFIVIESEKEEERAPIERTKRQSIYHSQRQKQKKKRMHQEKYVCFLCSETIFGDNDRFNEHLDKCLKKQSDQVTSTTSSKKAPLENCSAKRQQQKQQQRDLGHTDTMRIVKASTSGTRPDWIPKIVSTGLYIYAPCLIFY